MSCAACEVDERGCWAKRPLRSREGLGRWTSSSGGAGGWAGVVGGRGEAAGGWAAELGDEGWRGGGVWRVAGGPGDGRVKSWWVVARDAGRRPVAPSEWAGATSALQAWEPPM